MKTGNVWFCFLNLLIPFRVTGRVQEPNLAARDRQCAHYIYNLLVSK